MMTTVYRKHDSVEGIATTTAQSEHFDVDFISVIVNDGTDDIYINFDITTSVPTKITLKPTEVINDLPLRVQTIHFQSKSGSQPFRAWGLKNA